MIWWYGSFDIVNTQRGSNWPGHSAKRYRDKMMVFCGKGKMDGYFLTRSLILENFEKQRARHYQREIFLFFSVKISVEFSAIVSSFLSLHGFSLEEYYANAKGCSVSKTPFSPVKKRRRLDYRISHGSSRNMYKMFFQDNVLMFMNLRLKFSSVQT